MDPIRPEFELSDLAGLEYHRWVADVETTFVAKDFTSTIKPSTDAAPPTEKDKNHALMFLKRHIDPNIRWGYHNLKTTKELWDALDSRFGNIHDSLIPQLNADNKRITTFSRLINLLQVSKRHNEILVNNNARAVGKKKVPRANHGKVNKGKGPKGKRARHSDSHPHDPYPRGDNTSRGRGRKGHNRGRGRNDHSNVWHREGTSGHSGGDPKFEKTPKYSTNKRTADESAPCFRCGSTRNWYKHCKASSNIASSYKKYRETLQQEANYVEENDVAPDVNLTILDFLGNEDFSKQWMFLILLGPKNLVSCFIAC
ncbi:uncharacterized protein LOC113277165 [Papaver somniferum]|uniref:uncharacterized protein LOC113277165 n=1 Tax=Papaver somniferum TaxID=3469 RepID=UPI000E6F68FB|nr:uncharacterized protein LOC113277165 [Papaver somniferum]